MDYIQKIKLLNELMLNATPQNVDFTPQNGNYCVALIVTRPVHTWGYQKRNFKIKGRLEEGKTVSADLIAENEMLFGVEDLPYVAHEGDRTPIFKIIRASIFCAYAGLQLTDLHLGMRKIAWSDYPFKRPDKEEQAKAEIRFMKRLASVMTVPDHCVVGRSVVTHLTSTRLRDVMLYNKEYEPSLYGKIKDSIESLSPFIPAKDYADNVVPDVFVSQQDWENPRDTYEHQVIILNAKSKKKEQFWWDYLKLNIFLRFGVLFRLLYFDEPLADSDDSEVDCRISRKRFLRVPACEGLSSVLFESRRKDTGSCFKLTGSTG